LPRLRRNLAQAAGLVGAWSWMECQQPGRDLVGQAHLVQSAALVTYDGALGMNANATGSGASVTAPGYLQLNFPLTLVLCGFQVGTPSISADLFGVQYNAAHTTPFVGYTLGVNSTRANYHALCNTAGTQRETVTTGTTVAVGSPVWLGARMTSGSQTIYCNSVPSATTPTSFSGSITYGTSPPLFAGGFNSGISSGVIYEYALIYNRALPDRELLWLCNQGRDLFARKRDWAGWTAALGKAQSGAIIVASITANPGSIKVSTTQTITIAGTGTTFTTTAPVFSIAGVAGVSITGGSLVVIDNTHATIQIVSGTTRGTATITDATSGATAPLRIGKRLTPLWAPHRPYR
jgi:hypothetical protein